MQGAGSGSGTTAGAQGTTLPGSSGGTGSDAGQDGSAGSGGSGSETGPVAECGNGVVEGVEMCDGQDRCGPDCTYASNTIFWEVVGEGATPEDDALVLGVAFDRHDRPIYGGQQFETGGAPFAVLREPRGGVVWAQLFVSGFAATYAYGLGLTADDTIVLPGAVEVEGEWRDDAYASTFTIDGVPGWDRHVPDDADERSVAVAGYPDGSLVLAGVRRQGAVEDLGLLVRLGPDGSVLWSIDHEGPLGLDNRFVDVVVDDGLAVVLGCCDAQGEAMIAAYDGAGAGMWQTPLGDIRLGSDLLGGGLTVDRQGRVVAAAATEDNGTWIGTVDGDGTLLFEREVVGAEELYPMAIAATPQGHFVVGGRRPFGPEYQGKTEAWYGTIDPRGTLLWLDTITPTPGGWNAQVNAVAVDSHGLALVGGVVLLTGFPDPDRKGFARMFAP